MRAIHLLRKLCSEATVTANVLRWGAGAINVDGCRVASDDGYEKAWDRPVSVGLNHVVGGLAGPGRKTVDISSNKPTGGRWPANLLLAHLSGCGDECDPGCPVARVDAMEDGVSRFFKQHRTAEERLAYLRTLTVPDGGLFVEGDCSEHGDDTAHAVWLIEDTGEAIREAWRILRPGGHLLLVAPDGVGHRGACLAEDAGFEIRDCLFVADAAEDRIYYVAKPSTAEREEGTESLEARRVDHGRDPESVGANSAHHGQNSIRANIHPTVKPVEVMAELIASTCARGDLVVDPFLGSGTTGIAALQEEVRFLGIERDPEYVKIARARVAHWQAQQQPTLFGRLAVIGGIRYAVAARRP